MTDISEARQCSDLYDILESCTNEELTPIVDILVNSPESVLRISRAFECHAPDHVHYRDRIGDEVYRLGLQALGTGAIKRPSYAEMIARLCKQIGFASVPDNIDRNEGTLLNLFSKQYLSFIPASGDQQPQINEASTAISAAVRGILSSDAWAPFASIMLHMIYLRRKLVGEGRVPSSTTVDHHAVGREDTENTVVIQAENGDPVLALATIPDDGSQGWPDMQASLKVADALAPLLKAAEPFFQPRKC
ncbi:hypothetical protein RAA17_14225 [Komagataeibacter rhaeticus]|nr:hypothetical protein [Komagataeibacter rhaeticus]